MSSVVVFGRQPVPGSVKTRLATSIGDAAAAAVYGELLDHTLRTALDSGLDVVLSLSDEPASGWSVPGGVSVEVQPAGDLGNRISDAFARRFAEGHRRVVVVGSDCPWIHTGHLLQAMERLADHRVVLGPARDGGYWLVAQNAPGSDLFTSIPWSSPETLEATRLRIRSLGMEWAELEMLDDLDTEDALRRAVADLSVRGDLAGRLRTLWGELTEGAQ
jgi:rSAM/selenodomain-associated transferase 1